MNPSPVLVGNLLLSKQPHLLRGKGSPLRGLLRGLVGWLVGYDARIYLPLGRGILGNYKPLRVMSHPRARGLTCSQICTRPGETLGKMEQVWMK